MLKKKLENLNLQKLYTHLSRAAVVDDELVENQDGHQGHQKIGEDGNHEAQADKDQRAVLQKLLQIGGKPHISVILGEKKCE